MADEAGTLIPKFTETIPKVIDPDNEVDVSNVSSCSIECLDVGDEPIEGICELPSYTGFEASDIPTMGDIDTSDIDDLLTSIRSGDALKNNYGFLTGAVKEGLTELFNEKRINGKVFAEAYIALMGKAMDSANGAVEIAVNAEVAKVELQIKVDQAKIDRIVAGNRMIADQAINNNRIKESCANIYSIKAQTYLAKLQHQLLQNEKAIVLQEHKAAIRNEQLTGYWDRYLKAVTTATKQKQIELFQAQIKGFDSKKQNELIGRLIDTWTISATEELGGQWQFDFNKRNLSDPNDPESDLLQSTLEDWIIDFVADTPEIG